MGSLFKTFGEYWRLHGGWRGFAGSPYLIAALAITIVLNPFWTEVEGGKRTWPVVVLGIIPNLLGFALGGMAIVLAFSYSKMVTRLAQEGREESFFVRMITSFFHFILVQVGALFFAVAARTYDNTVLSFIGFWLFCYSLLSAVATAVFLFHTGRIFNVSVGVEAEEQKQRDKSG